MLVETGLIVWYAAFFFAYSIWHFGHEKFSDICFSLSDCASLFQDIFLQFTPFPFRTFIWFLDKRHIVHECLQQSCKVLATVVPAMSRCQWQDLGFISDLQSILHYGMVWYTHWLITALYIYFKKIFAQVLEIIEKYYLTLFSDTYEFCTCQDSIAFLWYVWILYLARQYCFLINSIDSMTWIYCLLMITGGTI